LISLYAGEAERARAPLVAAREAAVRALGESNLRTFRLGQALVRADRDSGKVDEALILQESLRQTARQIPELGADAFANMDLDQVNLLSSAGRLRGALSLSGEVLPRCIAALGDQAQLCRYLEVKHAQLLLKLGWADQALQAIPLIHISSEDANLPFLQIESLLLELRLLPSASASSRAGGAELASVFERVRQFANTAEMRPPLRAGAMLGLADSLLRTGDWGRAEPWISQALALLGDQVGQPANSRTDANARMLMGIVLLEQSRPQESLVWMRQSLKYFADSLGDEHPITQQFALNVALALEQAGNLSEAYATARRAQPLLRDALGGDTPAYQRILRILDRLKYLSGNGTQTDDRPSAHAPEDHGATYIAREFFSG
jgi:hypothetical protein